MADPGGDYTDDLSPPWKKAVVYYADSPCEQSISILCISLLRLNHSHSSEFLKCLHILADRHWVVGRRYTDRESLVHDVMNLGRPDVGVAEIITVHDGQFVSLECELLSAIPLPQKICWYWRSPGGGPEEYYLLLPGRITSWWEYRHVCA